MGQLVAECQVILDLSAARYDQCGSGDNRRDAKLQSTHHCQQTNSQVCYRPQRTSTTLQPHVGSGVVIIDPLHFLAGCRKSRLNQALSVLSLSLGFFLMYVLCC